MPITWSWVIGIYRSQATMGWIRVPFGTSARMVWT